MTSSMDIIQFKISELSLYCCLLFIDCNLLFKINLLYLIIESLKIFEFCSLLLVEGTKEKSIGIDSLAVPLYNILILLDSY
jgi:hypothetical protein